MKTRIISAAVGVVLLLAVLFCPFPFVFGSFAAILACVAVWELLHNTGYVKPLSVTVVSMAFAVVQVSFFYRIPAEKIDKVWFAYLFMLFVYAVAVMLLLLYNHASLQATQAGYAVFATLYASFGFASLAALRVMAGGLFLIFLVLVIPWMSDTGAYFVGTFLGEHKMTPVISPKKSWEGFFGGWVVSVISAVLTGVIFQSVMPSLQVNLYLVAVLAAVLAPLTVCGDLLASVIKRHSGIKDYGNLMPGHGGVMDRFDSVVIIAPLLYVGVILLQSTPLQLFA